MMHRRAIAILGAILITSGLIQGVRKEGAWNKAELLFIKRIQVMKTSGSINQVIVTSRGQLLVRDFNVEKLDAQVIELYSGEGRLIRKIGGYGKGPGKYHRLIDMQFSSDELVWVPDITRRINLFKISNGFLKSILLAEPVFPNGMQLDENNCFFYIGGRLAMPGQQPKLLHRYDLSGRYVTSFVTADQEIERKRIQGLDFTLLGKGPNGKLLIAQAPVHKIHIFNPADSHDVLIHLKSKKIKPVLELTEKQTAKDIDRLFRDSYLIDSIHSVAGYIIVSIRTPVAGKFLVEVLREDGVEILSDCETPGRLVGLDQGDDLIFYAKEKNGHFLIKSRLTRKMGTQ